jgi:hypothetical protein
MTFTDLEHRSLSVLVALVAGCLEQQEGALVAVLAAARQQLPLPGLRLWRVSPHIKHAVPWYAVQQPHAA